MDNIHDDVELTLEGPELGQDHEGALHQPDQPPLVLQQGAPKDDHHHPLITRFHPTSGPHDPHSLRWALLSELSQGVELSLGVYHRLG